MDFSKWRIKKRQGRWLLYMPYETKHLAAGSYSYCVSAMKYAFKVYYLNETKRWRDG